MKDLGLLIWLTQLGIGVVAPMVGYPLIAVWLRHRFDLGIWVVIVGVIFGITGAIGGLRDALKSMDRYIRRKKKDLPPPPPTGYCNHD